MRRSIWFVLPCTIVITTACDRFYVASAMLPIAAPVSDSCVQAVIGRGPADFRRLQIDTSYGTREVGYSTPSMFSNRWTIVAQQQRRDSGAFEGKMLRDSAFALFSSIVR